MKIFTILLCLLLFNSFGQFSFAQEKGGEDEPCDCSEALEPSFTFSSDPETCIVTFVGDAGGDCLSDLDFTWFVNGSPLGFNTGSSPIFIYETIDNIDALTLTVEASAGPVRCIESANMWLTIFTCENTSGGPFEFDVTKHAERVGGSNEINVLYTSMLFEWVITINSTSDDNFFNYIEFANIPADDPLVNCPFVYQNSAFIDYPASSGIPDVTVPNFPIAGDLCLPAGITEIRFLYRACGNGLLSGTVQWTNCFQYDGNGGPCISLDGRAPSGPTDEACDTVEIRYGCPMGMTDGFCMDETDLEAGDTIESELYLKRNFWGAKTMTGTLSHDTSDFQSVSVTLSDLFPTGFVLDTDDDGEGNIDFIIWNPLNPSATFNLGGAIRYPLLWEGELINDLDGCSVIFAENIVISNGLTGDQTPFADPGVFCTDYASSDPPYEEAIILTDPMGTFCYSGTPITLVADGPFEEENSTYVWDDGSTNQERVITDAGSYTVVVTDQKGCVRERTLVMPTCLEMCECGSLNPLIVTDENGCQVDMVAELPNCANIEWISYEWVFSNGNVSGDPVPPTQSFAGPDPLEPEIKLTIKYGIDGAICTEYVEKDLSLACRSKGLKLYPNPAKDYVMIDLESIAVNSGTIEIVSMVGNVLIQETFSNIVEPLECNISTLKSGLYFVRITDQKTGAQTLKRMLVE